MSRTMHPTADQLREKTLPKPRSQRSRLTKSRGMWIWPFSTPRPKNDGTRRVPTGGCAAARREHAERKRLGRRQERRRLNRQVTEDES